MRSFRFRARRTVSVLFYGYCWSGSPDKFVIDGYGKMWLRSPSSLVAQLNGNSSFLLLRRSLSGPGMPSFSALFSSPPFAPWLMTCSHSVDRGLCFLGSTVLLLRLRYHVSSFSFLHIHSLLVAILWCQSPVRGFGGKETLTSCLFSVVYRCDRFP